MFNHSLLFGKWVKAKDSDFLNIIYEMRFGVPFGTRIFRVVKLRTGFGLVGISKVWIFI